MRDKRLTIGIVIPVYNEESHLADCLRSVMAQELPFTEVIVVDNNSTDNSVAIARSFSGVKVIPEVKQGVVHARSTGFDATTGEIIARIDADTRLPADWSKTLVSLFTKTDIDAVSGRIEYYDMAAPRLVNGVDLFFRRYFAAVLGRQVGLQASNMAMRRETWLEVRSQTCQLRNLHEDFDLAIHASQAGRRVVFDERLVARVGYRQAESSFVSFCRYAFVCPFTYREHRLKGHWYMYPVVGLAIASFGILKLLHKGCDDTGRFSWRHLLMSQSQRRVNPATFVE